MGVSWKKICALAGVSCVYPAGGFYPRGVEGGDVR